MPKKAAKGKSKVRVRTIPGPAKPAKKRVSRLHPDDLNAVIRTVELTVERVARDEIEDMVDEEVRRIKAELREQQRSLAVEVFERIVEEEMIRVLDVEVRLKEDRDRLVRDRTDFNDSAEAEHEHTERAEGSEPGSKGAPEEGGGGTESGS